MARQFSVAMRNARADQWETTLGTSPRLKFFSGAEPANVAAADPSGLLATLILPADWMNAASAGAKTLLGSWTVAATAAGNAACYRLYQSDGTTCHDQGSVTATGGGGDITLDNINIAVGQVVTVSSFTHTEGNA